MATMHVKLAGGVDAAPAIYPSSWRTQWFWRWHAWRLRKHRAQENGCGVVVFDGFFTLEHQGYTDALFDLHLQLSRQTPGMLPENAAGFRQRLMRELTGNADVTLFTATDGSIGGYAWARVGRLADALAHFQMVPTLSCLTSEDWREVERRASNGLREAPVLALNGIGLGNPYRHGFAPLKQLLRPLLELGISSGATRALWWAPRSSPVYALSLSFGAIRVRETPTCAFFLLPDVRPLARILAALPASGIADLLARIAPPRPAKARPAVFERSKTDTETRHFAA